ncbi:Receptor-like serine/threonine-protein kinase SD1-8 [Citrus sinensis]|nr:Receptor-like serine/threonine-protein kinase SD1-8 [Citrus sinensis]
MEILPCFNIFSSLIFYWVIKFSLAADTLTPTTLIRDGETLVSPSQRFELGFFSPGKSQNRYVGIWYQQIPDTVVWVANRNSPIVDKNGVLTVSNRGNLVLLNQSNGTIWSSNVSREVKNPVAQLLDNGNLVIRDNSGSNSTESYLWQSFDYPTDTMLQGMKLGWDLRTGLERYQTSWKSADDPSPGNFTHRLDIHVLPQVCVYNGSAKYTCTGPWNGVAFGSAPSNTTFIFQPIVVQNKDEVYYMYESYSSPIIMILRVNPLGQVQRLIWHEMSTGWQVFFTAPDPFCHYGDCGPNSICSVDQTSHCECLEGFKFKSQQNQTCVRSHSSDCKSGDRFKKLDDIKLPDLLDVSLNESMNLKECEAECLKNCSCRAYANSKVTDGGSGCLMWFGDLIDLKKTDNHTNGVSIYIRVPASEQETKNLDTNQDLLAFDVNMGITTRTNEFCEADGDGKDKSKDSSLPLFSFASVTAATENFSIQSKLGEGGFGPVYKGRLLNGQEVAVKRLSNQSGQGLKEFKNEMMLIAKLQHRNLVRLLDPTKKHLLGWQLRVRIIDGIAQGLLYLHQYSRLRIIHRDLKASNILLDQHMNPKISDFGMARMFGGDELQGNTKRIVGTYGYMSPEYALEGVFSVKSDVFSFGVLMLEILSSKKNTGVYNTDSFNLLGHAWSLCKNDRAHELMDPVLQNEVSLPMLVRYINVALLCVQENAEDRPTMSDVVSMINNELFNLPSPKEPPFTTFTKGKNMKYSSNSTSGTSEFCSVNDVTVSLIYPR